MNTSGAFNGERFLQSVREPDIVNEEMPNREEAQEPMRIRTEELIGVEPEAQARFIVKSSPEGEGLKFVNGDYQYPTDYGPLHLEQLKGKWNKFPHAKMAGATYGSTYSEAETTEVPSDAAQE